MSAPGSAPQGAGIEETEDDATTLDAALRSFDARLSAVERRLGSRSFAGATAADSEARAFRDYEASRVRVMKATIERGNNQGAPSQAH
jgi:hypothetical protein